MNFVDTNILVYSILANQAPEKHVIAIRLLQEPNLRLSSQVVNELVSALRLKGKLLDDHIRRILEDLYFRLEVIDLISEDIFAAFSLRDRYNFSYWDSLLVATALRSGAKNLYSEDMQHGLVVDGRMTIWNPFTHGIIE
ncbi:MAG: PIN domain-containing protein [Candidatus Kapaibacterium sp.]